MGGGEVAEESLNLIVVLAGLSMWSLVTQGNILEFLV